MNLPYLWTMFKWILPLIFLLGACRESNDDSMTQGPKEKIIKEQFIKVNQGVIAKENDEMDAYCRSHKMNFTRTGSGIRYFVYKSSPKGDSITDGKIITMHYKVSLLNGTLCYESAPGRPLTFEVGHEDIESGIHKGVQYLKTGDKALLLIPSHLAHGLLGDMNKIPPQVPILYQVEIE